MKGADRRGTRCAPVRPFKFQKLDCKWPAFVVESQQSVYCVRRPAAAGQPSPTWGYNCPGAM